MKFIKFIILSVLMFLALGASTLSDDKGFEWVLGQSGGYLHVWATGVDSATTVTIGGIDVSPFLGKSVYSIAKVNGETTVDSTVVTINGKFIGNGLTVTLTTIQTVPTNGATIHIDTLNGITDLEASTFWDIVLTTPNLTESLKNGRVDLYFFVNGTFNTPFDVDKFLRETK
jgi:hypothetical protein